MLYEIEFRAALKDPASTCLRSLTDAPNAATAYERAVQLSSLIGGAEGFILWDAGGEPLALEKLDA